MEVSTLLLNFAVEEMNARRDKANTQPQLNQQLAAQDEQRRRQEQVAQKIESRKILTKKMGDFFFDVAKLIVGGVVLGGLMKQDIEYLSLLIAGIVAVISFLLLGMALIQLSNKN